MAKKTISNVPQTSAPAEKPWQFKPGNTGGPGRPLGSRNKLSESFLDTLLADWQANGKAAVAAARELDPGAYVRTIASLLPKQVEAEITNHKYVVAPDKMSDPEWKQFLEFKQQSLPVKQPSVKQTNGNGTTH